MIGRSLAVLAIAFACTMGGRAQAQDYYYGPRSEYSPSVFSYGYRGLSVGAIGGLSGGYLVARHDGFQRRDWRPLVLGAGIGALSGAGLGLVLGFADLADNRPGMGNIALRDMAYGGGFGAVVGLIVGALTVIKTRDAEHIPFATAVGALSGIGIGLIVGLIEGRRIVDSPAHRYSGKLIVPTLFAAADAREGLVWSGGAAGRF